MKFKSGLFITTLLLIPGWAAIVYWIIYHAISGPRWLPYSEQKHYGLILATMLGIILGLNVPKGAGIHQKILRTMILFFGVLSLLSLSFPLM